jgi:hypothetical protein
MNCTICDYPGCQKAALPDGFVYGRAYCEGHYLLGLETALFEELPSLSAQKPSTRFKNIFGRYVEQVYRSTGMSMPEELTGAKLKNRAGDFQYRDNTITFTIERHAQPIPIQQRWGFDIEHKVLMLISEEPALLDCSEAADILGKSEGTVRRYIKQGKIRAERASENAQVRAWFEDKLNKGHYETYIRKNRIIRPNKLLIRREEITRLQNE